MNECAKNVDKFNFCVSKLCDSVRVGGGGGGAVELGARLGLRNNGIME